MSLYYLTIINGRTKLIEYFFYLRRLHLAIKKYYWLKLQNDFFKSRAMKKLRKIAGGDTYTIIYLKLQLMSLKDEGHLFSEFIEDDLIDELALEIDEEIENVRTTLMFLDKCGLAEITNDQIILPQVKISTGSETSSASRVRKLRARGQKALQCNLEVTDCNKIVTTEKSKRREDIELKKDIEKSIKEPKQSFHNFDLVKLTLKEYESCITNYGEKQTIKALDKLNSFIGSSGKKYKSHFHTLGTWVWESVKAVKLAEVIEQNEIICEVF